jgi:hypothetical protein
MDCSLRSLRPLHERPEVETARCQLATAKPWSTSWSTVQVLLSDPWKVQTLEAKNHRRFMKVCEDLYSRRVLLVSIRRGNDSDTLETLEHYFLTLKPFETFSLARREVETFGYGWTV